MKILVAGGAGFIGSVLVPLLCDRGHDVSVSDLFWFGKHLPTDVPTRRCELFDLVEDDLAPFQQVIFLAGLSNDPMAEFNPAKNFVQNGALPSYLAYIAKNAGVERFVYASSCSVYGFTDDLLADEDSEVRCGYPYGISKLQGERGVLQLGDDHFSTIALRQGTVCGYSPRMRFDLIVNTMFKAALQTGRITIDNPEIWRPILDVRDAAQAFASAVDAPREVSGVYNVAYDNFTVGEIGEHVATAVRRLTSRPIELDVKDVKDFRSYRVSTERARRVLGFDPRYGVEAIVERLFEKRGEYGDFSKEAFYNIEVFKQLTG
ncbi:MAG: SDR family oxidoreductase [Deltaproteobacteria bacterium]|nr:SDR family oxidoreductase [Deltaproteobacteria bacterium]